MNKVILIGRITKQPQISSTAGGTSAIVFSLAVERRYKKDGEKITDFIPCVAYRQTAEYICNYTHKGDKLSVEGELHINSYTKDDELRYKTEIVCDDVSIVASVRKDEEA